MKGFLSYILFLPVLATGLVLMSAGAPVASAAGIPDRYSSIKVAKGIRGVHGAVAWSPGGKKIAYIRKNVEIYDVESGEKRKVRLGKPSFLAWASEGELLVLFQSSEGLTLAFVDADSLEQKTTALPEFTRAVYAPDDGGRLLLTAASAEQLSIGVSMEYALYALDRADGELKELLGRKRILHRYTLKDVEHQGGWLDAGPNPLGDELVLMEHVRPPNAPAYLRAYLVDVFAARARELVRVEPGALRPSGSWSPLGRRAAVVDEGGKLRILELDGSIRAVAGGIRGRHPAWSPAGDMIFFGGYLVKPSGGEPEQIVRGEPESAAFWSPDGKSMALVVDGRLRVLSGFEPGQGSGAPSREDIRRKIRILRELSREGFLSEREYEERYLRLTGRKGEGK
jgi:hypothetical protein